LSACAIAFRFLGKAGCAAPATVFAELAKLLARRGEALAAFAATAADKGHGSAANGVAGRDMVANSLAARGDDATHARAARVRGLLDKPVADRHLVATLHKRLAFPALD
jgi:hypothetical protein